MSTKNKIVSKNGVTGTNANGTQVELVNGHWQRATNPDTGVELGFSANTDTEQYKFEVQVSSLMDSGSDELFRSLSARQAQSIAGVLNPTLRMEFTDLWSEYVDDSDEWLEPADDADPELQFSTCLEELIRDNNKPFFESLNYTEAEGFARRLKSPDLAGRFIRQWQHSDPNWYYADSLDKWLDGIESPVYQELRADISNKANETIGAWIAKQYTLAIENDSSATELFRAKIAEFGEISDEDKTLIRREHDRIAE